MGLTVLKRPGLIFAAAAMVFWLVLVNYIPSSLQIEMLTALLLPLGGMALWRWLPGALRHLLSDALTPAKILTIAVATMAFAAAFQSIWRLVYLWLGRPIGMTSATNPWVGLPVFVFIISLVLYLLSTRRETDPPMPQLMWLVGAGAIVVLVIGFLIRLLASGTLVG